MSQAPLPLQGSSGTFRILDSNGISFNLAYKYEPSRIKTRPLHLDGTEFTEVQVEAHYSMEILNTSGTQTLSFKPTSVWEATFGLYALWESPNTLCDGILGPGRKGDWCGVELAHFHIEQEVLPGTSLQLTPHPGFSDSYPVEGGTVAVDPSHLSGIRNAFARPDNIAIAYQGKDGGRFVNSCYREANEKYNPKDAAELRDWDLLVAARDGRCRPFMDKSIFPGMAGYADPDDGYTYLD
ncbi:hypothetical protein ACTHQ6_02135 [Arthrobacter sp. SAFR-179]|uniref:hypothetical protein n=1 Tax=Arthrobacter sp. SAFR-179 TaxID=3387279 RepID=UPI003F7CA8CA